LEAPESSPRFLGQAPGHFLLVQYHQHTFLAADAVSGALGFVPTAKLIVSHASRMKYH
jgi:hypothetical protein